MDNSTQTGSPNQATLDRQKVSAVVISFNRVNLIDTCLRALAFADELIVVDKSSTDGTAEVAASLADRVISVPWSPTVEDSRAFAVEACTYDWIVCVDDDECLSVEAARFIESELRQPRADVYALPQRHYILGVHDERAYYWPEYQPRFFRRDAVEFRLTVHGGTRTKTESVYRVPPDGGVCIHHLSHENVAQWIEKANRYTSRMDRLRDDDGGYDLAAYAHARIDGWLGQTQSDDLGDYPAAVAMLRAVYDIIDRLKEWELEAGLDGAAQFQSICRTLQERYAAELPNRRLGRGAALLNPTGISAPAQVDPQGCDSSADRRDLALTVSALRDALRHVRAMSDAAKRQARESNALERAKLQAEADRAALEAAARQNHLEEALNTAQAALEQMRELMSRALADRTRRTNEQTGEIQALKLRVDRTEAQRASEAAARHEAESRLAAVLASNAWKVTAPLRSGIEAMRRSAHLQKARVNLLRRAVRGRDQEARRVLVASLRRRMGMYAAADGFSALRSTPLSNSAPSALLPHESVVASYPSWLHRLDTPDIETLEMMNATTNALPMLHVLVRFAPSSIAFAADTVAALQRMVGLRWNAFFIIDPRCSESAVAGLRLTIAGESRISVQTPTLENGSFVLLIEAGAMPRAHGPRVLVDALIRVEAGVLAYADEDQLPTEGSPENPWFKPAFSRLLARQGVLLGRMVAVRLGPDLAADLQSQLSDTGLAFDQIARDLALSLEDRHIVHVPHVLFHDVMPPASPIDLPLPSLPDPLPVASILIPTRDGWHLLGPCLESLRTTDWPAERLEVIVVDNGSTERETLDGMSRAEREGRIRVLRDPRPFNYARLNNDAARASRGDVLVLLNNDTEIIDPAWLRKLVAHAMQPGIGAVGPKLLYGDRTVQHAGVILGIQGVAAHAHLSLSANAGGYQGLANLTHEVSAVTGACLAVSRAAFEEVGGLREELRVAFNDVVFCLDLLARGRKNIYFAEPLVMHYESKTRGYDDKPEKVQLLRMEARLAWARHADLLRNDPYYSPNLSMEVPYGLSFAARRRPAWSGLVSRPLRVMMLSSTHARGHGVAVVINLQVRALRARGHEVIIAGGLGEKDFDYGDCQKVAVYDPRSAATIASELGVDLIVAHTPPFFDVARWTGAFPPVLAYDYGEPPPEFFPDAVARQEVLDHKALSLSICAKVLAISDAVAKESITPPDGIIPLGNGHLGRWGQTGVDRRRRTRKARAWDDRFVILNVCRFHSGERFYKGVDHYAEVRDILLAIDPILAARTLFVLCGKGTPEDVAEMTARGLHVIANVSDEEMTDLYAAADVYANFSRWEGYNLGIGQALAMGLSVIASDIPAHRAFGVSVTNDPVEAALLLRDRANDPVERVPKVWEWDRPLATFTDEVEAACVARDVSAAHEA
ncbi:glycosyltransferase [Paraburkholderia phenazinium]|uniref:Glycosyltransferase, GT2 family n=1 Tax=Paraburkholderia phenazinium TaxID=60549 RepID=A0A1N6I1H6_9BURK|nr:glycosyltransferase [Paraburkholderia phenazinium]SIO25867.1 Glycosyltransferase, GT2 family [Paraburkholderia phenazinium]